jgi:hypothetical protein
MPKNSSIEEFVADFMEGSNKQTLVLLEIIGNQQRAIASICELLEDVPGMDESRLGEIIQELESFQPDLS